MLDFQIKKSTRQCSQTGREFGPGEVFYSALIENENGTTSRLDYGADQWSETPQDCIGWWKSQVPESGKGKIYWAPKKVMLAFFKHVLGQPISHDVAYVTALLLIQKKYLSLIDDGETETMTVQDRQDKETYAVAVMNVDDRRMAEIQELLAEQLFMDEPIGDEPLEDSHDA